MIPLLEIDSLTTEYSGGKCRVEANGRENDSHRRLFSKEAVFCKK